MNLCFFVSDLHGKTSRYQTLFNLIRTHHPRFVMIGGDITPSGFRLKPGYVDFINGYLAGNFIKLKEELKEKYPDVFIIMGNDDPASLEKLIIAQEKAGIWKYLHNRKILIGKWSFYGYACVPPTPFLLKDWERYDVSRYVDPGCVPPTEGFRTIEPDTDIEYTTIENELKYLVGEDDLSNSVFLFHTPPYKTNLDRAALDGKKIDHVPLDVHVGSIALKRFIEERKPYITLHGHIHESSGITGHWSQKEFNTMMFSAAWNGNELSLIRFDLEEPSKAQRLIL